MLNKLCFMPSTNKNISIVGLRLLQIILIPKICICHTWHFFPLLFSGEIGRECKSIIM